MSTVPCPFCGELSAAPLKFCVSCGRGASQEELQHSPLKITRPGSTSGEPTKRISESGVRSGRFARSRRDYTLHRQLRSVFWSSTWVLALLLGYFCTMRYVLHEHLPFKVDLIVESWVTGAPMPSAPDKTTTASRPAGTLAPVPSGEHKKPGARNKAHRKSKTHQGEIVRAR